MRFSQILERAAQTAPRTTANICDGRLITWKEKINRVRKTAACLRDIGLKDGERVAILAQNSDYYIELMFSISWAGGVFVPLNTRWSPAEIAYALKECSTGYLFCDESLSAVAEAVADLVPGLKLHRLDAAPGSQPRPGFLDFITSDSEGVDPSPRSGTDICAIYFTGGATGRPKGVCLSHANFVYAALNWVGSFGIDSETVYMHVAGFFHLGGSGPAIATALAGGTNVMIPKFDPELAAQTIEAYEVNYTLLVPVMMQTLVNHDAVHRYDLSSVRMCHYGGAPMPDSLLKSAMELLPSWQFIQGYGQTEATAILTVLEWKDHLHEDDRKARRRSVGRATYGWEIRIADEAGRLLPAGQVGEIIARSPAVSPGYWGAEGPMTDADGWLRTGDGAWMDEDGYIFIVDRLKDMIVTGGENVFSAEVENAIYNHPAVLECAVFAIPDEAWGEAVHAVVVPRTGADLTVEEIRAHVRSLLAGFKVPKSVTITPDPLPRSAAGKVTKASLRDPYWAGRDRRVN